MRSIGFLNADDNLSVVEQALRADRFLGQVGGFQVVCDSNKVVIGIITDSDLRRARSKFGPDYATKRAGELMKKDFIYLYDDLSIVEQALSFLEMIKHINITKEWTFNFIPILNRNHELIKIIHFSDLQPYIEKFTTQVIVIGLGYVGLTLSMTMVLDGLEIFGFESNTEIRENIMKGKSHVYEPSLEDCLKSNIGKKFSVVESTLSEFPRKHFLGKRTYIVTVGTPIREKKIDYSQLDSAVEDIAVDITKGDMVVIRSSVPIGTTRERVIKKLERVSTLACGLDFNVVYAPERTVEGDALREGKQLPQLISGATPRCAKRGVDFFSQFIPTIILMETLEACEMGKLISNAYRDVTFAFANEVAEIAAKKSINVNRMIADVNRGYARNNIPLPSPGVGGPCLTKDSYLLLSDDNKKSAILSARHFNASVPVSVASLILENIESNFSRSAVIVCIGIAFKGNPPTNDYRESPALTIISRLRESNLEVIAIDNEVDPESIMSLGYKSSFDGLEERIQIICVLNNHNQNFEVVKDIIARTNVKDNLWLFDPWHVCEPLYKNRKFKQITDMSFTNLLESGTI